MSQQLKVQGLTCGHCANAVSEELAAIAGVTDVTVSLVPGGVSTVLVQAASELTTDQIQAALSEAGDYQLV